MNTRLQASSKCIPPLTFRIVPRGLLQRKCACGGTPGPSGKCEECRKKRLSLQRKTLPTEAYAHHSTLSSQDDSCGVSPFFQEVIHSPSEPLHADTRAFLEPHIGHNFGAVHIQRARFIEGKLSIDEPGDVYEREADRVADQVLRMQTPASALNVAAAERTASIQLQRQSDETSDEENLPVDYDMPSPEEAPEEMPEELAAPAPTPVVGFGIRVQRHCAACTYQEQLQRTVLSASTGIARTGAALVPDAGQPLAVSLRGFFEPRFGYSFDQVRVHTGGAAAESARAVNALAYTVGRDIVFGAGQYRPDTSAGQRLLAHELTHVVQQNGVHGGAGRRPMLQRWSIGDPVAGINTIVCDGKGGVTTQLGATGNADQTRCLKDCMEAHEQSHRSDALAEKANICSGVAAGKTVRADAGAQQKATEIKASNAEIDCIKPQVPKVGEVCKKIMQDRISQMEKYRDSFK